MFVEDSNGQFVIESSYCNGANPQVVGDKTCYIPMTALWTVPYSLTQDTEVRAKVQATNERGTSTISTVSVINASIQVVPKTMTQPTRGP